MLLTLLMLVDPEIPHNEGILRPIEVVIPRGTILNADFPRLKAPPALLDTTDVANQTAVDRALASLFEPTFARRADPAKIGGA